MNYAVESFTGARPTADLTLGNYLGAIDPVLTREAAGEKTAIFLADLHAATTHDPRKVVGHSIELARTLIAADVQSEIYSQRDFTKEVMAVELAIRGLVSTARLLRLPTLKDKIKNNENLDNANTALLLYPVTMAADIILARPREVPTGKDQLPHLEITNEIIRKFNRAFDASLPAPAAREVEPVNIMSLDGSGTKMSKTLPRGAVFLSDTPDVAHKKIVRARTASGPGPEMNEAIDNMLAIALPLGRRGVDLAVLSELTELGERVKQGEPGAGNFKGVVGDIVAAFLRDINERRESISDADVADRLARGREWFAPTASETAEYVESHFWGDAQ